MFPKITAEMEKKAAQRAKADIFWVTLCNKCDYENYGLRIGCKCGGAVIWILKTNDDRYLVPGLDVSLLDRA